MNYLTPSDVVTIHDTYVERFGGSFGIRDERLLESAVFRCQSSFGGQDLYPTVFDKTAALLHSLLFNHPFVDGNKRAALFSADRFLSINKYELSMTNQEAVAFPLAIENTRPDIDTIAAWLKEHSKKVKKSVRKVESGKWRVGKNGNK